MATTFPEELDSFLNPQPTDSVAAVSHAAQHADANDAIEALQVKVGKDNSTDVNSIDYRLRFLENNPVDSEIIQDAIANAFASGDQSQVTVSYNDELNAFTLLVNQAQTAGYTSQVKHYVKNSSGETISIGTPVYVSGASGTNILITPASNIAESSSSKTLGLLAQTLANNTEGFVVAEGLLAGLDTSSANAGDPVWLGPNGTLIYGLANKPSAPNHLVFIGIVTRSQLNNGEIFVKVQTITSANSYTDIEISELSTVYDPIGSAANALTDANEYTDFAVASLGNNLPNIYVPLSSVGSIDGVASLGPDGKVPASELNITETIQDVAAEMITGATHTNVSVSYDDNTGKLSFVASGTGGTSVIISPTPPNNPSTGNIWLDSDNGDTFIWDGAYWVEVGGGGGGGASVAISSNPPVAPNSGDIWLDSDNAKTYIWDGAYWIEVGGSSSQAVAAVNSVPPTNPILGSIWMNSSTAKTYIYDGSFWVQI